MRMAKYLVLALFALTIVGVGAFQAQDEKPKYTIKEVMKIAHKDGLLKKVASGKADKEEAEKLVELYVALCQNDPPKGDKEAWVKRCKGIVEAAKNAAAKKKGAAGELGKATNCKACHSEHR